MPIAELFGEFLILASDEPDDAHTDKNDPDAHEDPHVGHMARQKRAGDHGEQKGQMHHKLEAAEHLAAHLLRAYEMNDRVGRNYDRPDDKTEDRGECHPHPTVLRGRDHKSEHSEHEPAQYQTEKDRL